MGQDDKPRFIVDANVGRLAKWLRALGFDTLSIKDVDDDTLVRTGLLEERIVLTRDSKLMERRVVTLGPLKALFIQDDDVSLQLRQVVKDLGLEGQTRPFSLCIQCNRPLEAVAKADVPSRVPPYVFETQSLFSECPSCEKVYWPGTHWRRMAAALRKAGMWEMVG